MYLTVQDDHQGAVNDPQPRVTATPNRLQVVAMAIAAAAALAACDLFADLSSRGTGMRRLMTSLLALLSVFLILGALVLPAQAKAPSRITVKGPGIEGEVDLLETTSMTEAVAFLFPYELIAEPLSERPTGDLGEAHILTWYAVLGAAHIQDSPQPLWSQLAWYPEASAVHVVEGFDHYQGWYQARPEAEASLSTSLERVGQQGLVGAAGYVFESEGTGRGAHADWVAQPLRSEASGLLPIAGWVSAALAIAVAVVNMTSWSQGPGRDRTKVVGADRQWGRR